MVPACESPEQLASVVIGELDGGLGIYLDPILNCASSIPTACPVYPQIHPNRRKVFHARVRL